MKLAKRILLYLIILGLIPTIAFTLFFYLHVNPTLLQSDDISINELLKVLNKVVIIRAIIGFGSITYIGFYIHKRFTSRIYSLHKAARGMAEGDFEQELKDLGNDELGDLYKEFLNTRKLIKESEDRIIESNHRFELAVKGAKDVIWDWDLNSGKIYVGDKWWEILDSEAVGDFTDLTDWQKFVHNDDILYFSKELNSCISGENQTLEMEYRIIRNDGTIKWLQTRGAIVLGYDGSVVRIAGSHTDITIRKIMEQKMAFNAFYDPLTELPNRTMLIDRIKLSLSRANRNEDYCFSVLFLDFDGFKHVNDTYGHSIGDDVLIEISKRLTDVLRPLDLVTRIGGDEFVIIVDGVSNESILLPIIKRILETSKNEFKIKDKSIYISVSIGIATNCDGMSSPEELIQQSDIAMYHSKLKGKSCYTIFTQKLKKEVSLRWSLEHELHKALGTKELQVYYQPIVATHDGNIHSFEALLRWKHPVKGMISPGEFIPAAEETGFITNMTKWILSTICLQACRWNASAENIVKISCNVTAKDFFIDGGLDRFLEKILIATGCDPKWIAIEVTESVMISDFHNVTKQLQRIRSFGVKIKLDDFGTGYSSLSYLNKFEIDYLKIDKSFIESINKDEVSRKIVQLIIHLAREMNYKTVAEGVEIEEELNLVAGWGCDYIQGYYYSKPLPVEDATKYLNNFF